MMHALIPPFFYFYRFRFFSTAISGHNSQIELPLLQKFRLVDCNFVSWDSLSPITLGDNDLQDLELDRCKNIHRSHIEKYKKYLAKKKYVVNVTWR